MRELSYCPRCGAKLRKGAKFCSRCGAAIEDISRRKKIEIIDPSYEEWKKKGRISVRKCDIFCFIGLFIFGWLLLVVYDRAGKGKRGWKLFIPIILLWILGYWIYFIFGLIGLSIYIYGWYSIRKTIKRYQKMNEMELRRKVFKEEAIQEMGVKRRKELKRPIVTLGLADPKHPAREEIDKASAIADEIIEIFVGGFSCNSYAARSLISAIDEALRKSPSDLDLLVAKSGALCLAAQFKIAEEILDEVLSINPEHFEAKQRKHYWNEWHHLFAYPPWSENATTLHPVILDRLRRRFVVQIVRDGLQIGVGIFYPASMDQFPKGLSSRMRSKWQPILSETPYGPLIAHYILIEDDPENPYIAEAFLNPSVSDEVNPFAGYWLIQRLANLASCFIVLVDGYKILYNRRFLFPEKLRDELKSISETIVKKAPQLDEEAWRAAIDWHTTHFDLGTIKFLAK